jgi:membrane protease YdiL (CAAX protease family)
VPSPALHRPASLRLLVAAFAAYSLAHLFNNTVLALEGPRAALARLQAASGGWIEPVLVRSQVVLAAFLVVVCICGRRPPADVGLRARAVLPGLLVYAAAWVGLQLVLLGLVLARGQPLALHPMWTRFGIAAVLGGVLAQGLGHALVEDTAFRGFFLPELRARFARRGLALVLVLTLAVGGSALLFGLAHLPTRVLVKGSGLAALVSEQGHFLSAGVALGAAYLATRNLFAVVGLHVLLNDPAPLLDVPGTLLNRAVLAVFALVVLACWTLPRPRQQRPCANAEEVELRQAA